MPGAAQRSTRVRSAATGELAASEGQGGALWHWLDGASSVRGHEARVDREHEGTRGLAAKTALQLAREDEL